MTTAMEHEDYLESHEYEDEDFLELAGEHEHEHEDEQEDEDFLESQEYEDEDFLGGLLSSVLGGEVAGPLGEQAEQELAAELLEVGSEQELEQFIGKLFRSAVKGVGDFARSKAGRAIGGALKGIAKKALPIVGGALGSFVAPGVGTAIGSKLGSLAGGLLETEDEVGEQELEYEMARRIVRIGATAARSAARATPRGASPDVVARRAVVGAVRRHAPAALTGSRAPGNRYRSGAGTDRRFRTRRPATGSSRGYGGRPRSPQRRRRDGRGYPTATWGGSWNDGWAPDAGGPADGYDAGGYPTAPTGRSSSRGGRWVRRGRTIVLLDL